MKKIQVIPLIIVGLMILLVALFPMFIKKELKFSPELPDITTPEDCSTAEIEALWIQIFQIDETDTTIKTRTTTEGECERYLAYKIIEETPGEETAFILYGEEIKTTDTYPNTNITMKNISTISAIKTILHADNILTLRSFSEPPTPKDFEHFLLDSELTPRTIPLEITSEANDQFTATFKNIIFNYSAPPVPENWTDKDAVTDNTIGFFIGNYDNEQGEELNFTLGGISADYTYNLFTYNKYLNIIQSLTCTSNWTIQNNPCQSDDTYLTWYEDTNECDTTTGKPANITRHCDYDNNGLIGNFSDFIQTRLSLNVYVDSRRANASQTFNNSKTIEFKEGTISRVKFDYDFDEPLNMKNIEIKKQTSTSDFGYLIINGINETKTVVVDRINSSNGVCVRDSHVESMSEFSDDCSDNQEYIVRCPGQSSNGRYQCNVSSTKYTISGIRKSAIKEFTISTSPQTPTPGCIQNWTCSDWGTCTNNIQRRICMDLKNCNNNTGKPSESKSCTPTDCQADWTCSDWTPTECPQNKTQTRNCVDTNNCESNKTETRTCTIKKSNTTLIIFIIIIIAIIATALVIILYVMKKSKKYKKTEFTPTPPTPPTTPSTPPSPPTQSQAQPIIRRQVNSQTRPVNPQRQPINPRQQPRPRYSN